MGGQKVGGGSASGNVKEGMGGGTATMKEGGPAGDHGTDTTGVGDARC
jgi:hypothetical protein